MLSPLKTLLLGAGLRPRRIRSGPGRGLRILSDPRHDTQEILGLAEAELSRHFRRWAPWCRTFCDVGASNGRYGLIVRRLNPGCHVVAVEPSEERARQQEQNRDLNPEAGGEPWVLLREPVGKEGLALDEVLGAHPDPLLLKIDIEGAELDALESGTDTLASRSVVVILEVHSRELERACRALLEERGYQVRVVSPAWWRLLLPEHRPLEHNRWLVAVRV